jgi:hypothetical protein
MTSTGPRNRGRPADAKNRVTSLVEMARPAPKEGTIATVTPSRFLSVKRKNRAVRLITKQIISENWRRLLAAHGFAGGGGAES